MNTEGLPNSGWICPSAPPPYFKDPGPSPPAGGSSGTWSWSSFALLTNGTVFSAWASVSYSVSNSPKSYSSNRTERIGSYGSSAWIGGTPGGSTLKTFEAESQITSPALTPVIGDSVYMASVVSADDRPAADLFLGGSGIGAHTIPRHGSRPSRVPRAWPASQPLPGAVNFAFYEGHVETVQLERLWQLHWHRDYIAPA